ncbi:MAG: hypothetical protein QXT26_02015 [Thermoproteota archaeon]
MQKGEVVYSIGNLLVLIGIMILAISALFTLMSVSGLLRTGINILSSLLLLVGSAIPIILKEMEISQRLKSIGIRCFTTSFIMSIIMVIQMLTRGWASTVPVLASTVLAALGIASYMLSAKGGKLTLPPLKEVLLVISTVIIFATPMIQLSLRRLGISIDVSRTISISLLVIFTTILFISIKMPLRGERAHSMREEKAERNP